MDAERSWGSVRDLRTAAIELRAALGTGERDRILGRLMSQPGVEDVSFGGAHEMSLLIEFDANVVTRAGLVNSLYCCGL